MTTFKQALLQKVKDRTARVAVVGIGYVGLPLAVEFAEAGFEVTAVDVDTRKVELLMVGESYIEDIPSERARRCRPLHSST
jgi:UDP-N-acetyl-D-glucosamine dehydrogenase